MGCQLRLHDRPHSYIDDTGGLETYKKHTVRINSLSWTLHFRLSAVAMIQRRQVTESTTSENSSNLHLPAHHTVNDPLSEMLHLLTAQYLSPLLGVLAVECLLSPKLLKGLLGVLLGLFTGVCQIVSL